MENVWIANIVTGGFVVTLIAWLFNRMIRSFDLRLTKAEEKAEEIETNYNEKFREMTRNISASEQNIREHFNRRLDQTNEKLDKVISDKSDYRIQQGRWQGSMEEKLNNLVEHLKNGKP